MRVLRGDPFSWAVEGPGTALTVGVFDGVHVGHRAVLRFLVDGAREAGLVPGVLTFDPHPLEVLAPERAPRLLMTVEQRLQRLAEEGVEVVGVLPFDLIHDTPADVFARRLLAERLRAGLVVVGADFRFGRDRTGDVGLLRQIGAESGFVVVVVDLVGSGDGTLSSTRARRLLAEGDVETAAAVLGRCHEVSGRVVEGSHRGRDIGFPTANLDVPGRIALPADGVYAAEAVVEDGAHPAVVNVGQRPTFGPGGRVVEAHLLDLSRDLYGEQMTLRFVARLRPERRFASVDELAAQLRRDVAEGRRILEARG